VLYEGVPVLIAASGGMARVGSPGGVYWGWEDRALSPIEPYSPDGAGGDSGGVYGV
jgi:hypothetical protein